MLSKVKRVGANAHHKAKKAANKAGDAARKFGEDHKLGEKLTNVKNATVTASKKVTRKGKKVGRKLAKKLKSISGMEDDAAPTCYRVIYAYSPQADEQECLFISPGEILQVLKQPNEQWWYAVSTKGEYGYVPSHCLVPIKEAAGIFSYLEIPPEPDETKQAGTRTQVSAINRGKHVTVYSSSSSSSPPSDTNAPSPPSFVTPMPSVSCSSSSSSSTSSTSPTSLTSSSSSTSSAFSRSSAVVRLHAHGKRRLTAFSDEAIMEAVAEEQSSEDSPVARDVAAMLTLQHLRVCSPTSPPPKTLPRPPVVEDSPPLISQPLPVVPPIIVPQDSRSPPLVIRVGTQPDLASPPRRKPPPAPLGGVSAGGLTLRVLTIVPALDVGVADDPNERCRPTMEDAHVIDFNLVPPQPLAMLTSRENTGYFAVYDGHGGTAAVDLITKRLHRQLQRELNSAKPVEAIKKAFLNTDSEMKGKAMYGACGSTVVCALILPSTQGRTLFAANAGDARAVLARVAVDGNWEAIRLTRDHKPDVYEESVRVAQAGGWVMRGRLDGSLAVSRALGDFNYKDRGLIADPDVVGCELDERHQFLILACDGLWDVVSDDEAVMVIRDMDNSRAMAQTLVDLAMAKGTTDNVTVMVVKLQKKRA